MLVMKNNLCKNEKEGVSWIYVTPFLNYLTGRQVCVRNYLGRCPKLGAFGPSART